ADCLSDAPLRRPGHQRPEDTRLERSPGHRTEHLRRPVRQRAHRGPASPRRPSPAHRRAARRARRRAAGGEDGAQPGQHLDRRRRRRGPLAGGQRGRGGAHHRDQPVVADPAQHRARPALQGAAGRLPRRGRAHRRPQGGPHGRPGGLRLPVCAQLDHPLALRSRAQLPAPDPRHQDHERRRVPGRGHGAPRARALLRRRPLEHAERAARDRPVPPRARRRRLRAAARPALRPERAGGLRLPVDHLADAGHRAPRAGLPGQRPAAPHAAHAEAARHEPDRGPGQGGRGPHQPRAQPPHQAGARRREL
ncbi:MAG: hypothetical protein AVDCRST_MAG45-324, partial [uncultured Solirubrobacterales bacterium]